MSYRIFGNFIILAYILISCYMIKIQYWGFLLSYIWIKFICMTYSFLQKTYSFLQFLFSPYRPVMYASQQSSQEHSPTESNSPPTASSTTPNTSLKRHSVLFAVFKSLTSCSRQYSACLENLLGDFYLCSISQQLYKSLPCFVSPPFCYPKNWQVYFLSLPPTSVTPHVKPLGEDRSHMASPTIIPILAEM